VAQAAIAEGEFAQAFPSFGPERRGAPVLSFNRISEHQPIRIRAGINNPDIVIVLDPSLLHIARVTSGLKKGGALIINTTRAFKDIEDEIGKDWKLATIDASSIAREVLGVPIVNTTMIGALLKVTDLVRLDAMEKPLKARFALLAQKNIDAMRRAYNETKIKEL